MLRRSWLIVFALAAFAAPLTASSQAYPTRSIRVIVPFGPGAPDSVARIVGQQLSVQLGQPMVIDNRPGANGIIGNDIVAKANPDGYTVLITSVSFAVNPSMQKKLPHNALRDFVPVSNIADQEAMIVVVNPALPAHTVQELIAYAKRPDSKLAFASIGIGNTTHLAGELFLKRAGIQATHIPYKGGGAAVAAVMSGEVQMMVVPATQSINYIQSGKLRALAYTHPTRAALLPQVPTVREAGVQGAEFQGGWFGMFAPAGTSPAIVSRLAAEIRAALSNAQVKERLAALGLRPIGNTPEEFKTYVESEIRHYADIVRLTGIEPQ